MSVVTAHLYVIAEITWLDEDENNKPGSRSLRVKKTLKKCTKKQLNTEEHFSFIGCKQVKRESKNTGKI